MLRINYRIFLFIILVALSGCHYIANPEPFGIYRGMTSANIPDAPPDFQAGWKDGCESGMAAYGSLHYKATHGYLYNTNMLNNNTYHNAWRVGFRHCRWYTASWTKFN